MSKTVLIICRNNLAKAPRFMMEVDALKSDYHILASGIIGHQKTTDYVFINLIKNFRGVVSNLTFHVNYPYVLKKIVSLLIKVFFCRSFYVRKHRDQLLFNFSYKQCVAQKFDLIIVHHFSDLALAVKLARKKNVKVIFNAHEYYPLEFDDRPDWMERKFPVLMEIGRKNLPFVSICFCVGKIIAEKYKQEFNINSVVIPNAKPFYNLSPGYLNDKEPIKLIHHGIAARSRKLELMIEMMSFLNFNYKLDLILVPGDETYISELKTLASNHSNIRFLEPVTVNEIPIYTNTYDIGLFLLPPTNFNYKYALPNKFFEFVQARLAIAIAPSPEMEELVHKYDLGVVSIDFTPESLAEKIKELTPEKIMYYKNQCHKYAGELSVEKNWKLIKETVDKLVN